MFPFLFLFFLSSFQASFSLIESAKIVEEAKGRENWKKNVTVLITTTQQLERQQKTCKVFSSIINKTCRFPSYLFQSSKVIQHVQRSVDDFSCKRTRNININNSCSYQATHHQQQNVSQGKHEHFRCKWNFSHQNWLYLIHVIADSCSFRLYKIPH